MRISKKEDYAVLLMGVLAETGLGQWVSLETVATRLHLPLPFLQRIAGDLKRAKLLKSREGVKGGYALARNPKNITLAEILEATGGKFQLTACTINAQCPVGTRCTTRAPWRKLHDILQEIFKKTTLQKLASLKERPSKV